MSSDGTIDRVALARLRRAIGDDPEDLRELVEGFAEEGPDLLASLAQSAEAGDVDGLRRAAHTLKGSARDFGAVGLAEICAGLEDEALVGMPADAPARAEAAAWHFAAALAALSAMIDAGDLP